MSRESAYQFMEKAYNDHEFRQGLQSQASMEDIVACATQVGYEFTAQELQEVAGQFYESHGIELSEDQLEDAAGGIAIATTNANIIFP